jgi:hypothetical protein
MIKKKYSSKMEGFSFFLEAVAVSDGVKITLLQVIRASSEQEAVSLFEEWIEEKMEGFYWDITCEEVEVIND